MLSSMYHCHCRGLEQSWLEQVMQQECSDNVVRTKLQSFPSTPCLYYMNEVLYILCQYNDSAIFSTLFLHHAWTTSLIRSFEHGQNSAMFSMSIKTMSLLFGFPLCSYQIVQSSCCIPFICRGCSASLTLCNGGFTSVSSKGCYQLLCSLIRFFWWWHDASADPKLFVKKTLMAMFRQAELCLENHQNKIFSVWLLFRKRSSYTQFLQVSLIYDLMKQ